MLVLIIRKVGIFQRTNSYPNKALDLARRVMEASVIYHSLTRLQARRFIVDFRAAALRTVSQYQKVRLGRPLASCPQWVIPALANGSVFFSRSRHGPACSPRQKHLFRRRECLVGQLSRGWLSMFATWLVNFTRISSCLSQVGVTAFLFREQFS